MSLIKFLVIKALHIRIDTTDNIEDHPYDDDEPRTWYEKIDIRRSCGTKYPKIIIELRDRIREYGYQCEKHASKEIESIRNFLKEARRLFSRSYTRDIASSFLDIFGDFCSIESDRYIEKCKTENEERIDQDIDPARILHREVGREPSTDICWHPRSPFLEDLTDQRRESDKGHREDDRYHSCLIDTDREVRSLISTRSGIDKWNLSISFSEFYDDIDNRHGQEGEDDEESITSWSHIIHDMCRYSGEDSCEDDDRGTIPDTRLCDKIPEPEKDHRSSGDIEHSREYGSPEISSIDDLRTTIPCTDEGIEEVDHTVALSECEWNREVTSIVIHLLLSCFSLFFQWLERWDDHREELYDDRRIDIRRQSHEDDREVLETTTHDRTKKWELCIEPQLFCEGFEESDIHSWNRYHWKELIDCHNSECDEDLFADMFGCPDFSDIGDHRMILRIWRILGKKWEKAKEIRKHISYHCIYIHRSLKIVQRMLPH